MKLHYPLSLLIALALLAWTQKDTDYTQWASYLGGPDRNHYSTLNQITPENVKDLQVAWTYSLPDSGQMQANPIIVDGVLYGVSASVQAFALDAATGKEIWRFGDPLKNGASTSRGVSYAKGRILYTVGPNLWALDAKTGKPIDTFGDKGKVDLHTGLPAIAQNKFIISNTPGTVFENLIVMPLRLSEGADAAPGDIRAYDIYTGKVAWTFHTIPYPGEFGYETFPKDAYKNEYTGAANNWSGMALDEKRGILYVPTGSAGFDFYGGNRKGSNLFANCLLALDARTGKRLWHFQTTHHDVWDRDLPAPPNLITVMHRGKPVDAVVQVTKQGYVFCFDRVTGKPLFPIIERPVKGSTLLGEHAWKTQPMPTIPKPYARQSDEITAKDINPYANNTSELIQKFGQIEKGWHAAPTLQGNLILPGFDGGAEWGGAGADPKKGIVYINSNEMPWILTMVSTKQTSPTASKTYTQNCASCHGDKLQGNPASGYPSLTEVFKRRNKVFLSQIITQGKGMMPGFPQIDKATREELVNFIAGETPKEVVSAKGKTPELPYRMTGYNKFLDSQGLPAIGPPWGTLQAIDMNTGKYLWKIPFGDEPILAAKNILNTGTENYGGPLITENGLLAIAASKDGMFRIYNRHSGQILWKTKLPAAGFATPATYQVNGKQYIVIACGGTKLGTKKGNQYVAFSLNVSR
jgi:quinoprotein glucose dehydrogenase